MIESQAISRVVTQGLEIVKPGKQIMSSFSVDYFRLFRIEQRYRQGVSASTQKELG